MPTLQHDEIASLLDPFLPLESDLRRRFAEITEKLSVYLDLLVRWNARTNLTSVRAPEEMVQRHFGESVFAAAMLEEFVSPGATLLDFGSGGGFPGLPMQICLPHVEVCLAESQGKKAAFLREVIRTLGLQTEVCSSRVQAMPPERMFDVVTLRAVDGMEEAVEEAGRRAAEDGLLLTLSGADGPVPFGWHAEEKLSIPNSKQRFLQMLRPRRQPM